MTTKAKPAKHRKPLRPRARRWIFFGVAFAVAIVFVLVAPRWMHESVRAVYAYDAGVIVLLGLLWSFGVKSDAARTRSRADIEDPGRNVDMTVALGSIAVGLTSAIMILGREQHATTVSEKALIYGAAICAVVVGWLLIHTLYLFRYAHLYYFNDDEDQNADQGLDFPGTKEPNDYDFAYFSFVIGMTFQVSDVQITDQGVRKVALTHALISFAYNTAIVALGINLLSSVFH